MYCHIVVLDGKGGFCMAILIILIIALILYAAYKTPERQAHHYLPPEGMEIDWVLLQKDIGSDISKQQINQKMTRGSI